MKFAPIAFLLSGLLFSARVHAGQLPAGTGPFEIPDPDSLAPVVSCDPTVATEGRWLFVDDVFKWRAHSVVFDSKRSRLIAYGGTNWGNRGPVNQSVISTSETTWVRPSDLSAPWQRLVTGSIVPPRRAFHVAIYDPVSDRMILYGGERQRGLGDVWQLDLTATPVQWTELHPEGPAPLARRNHTGIYDPVGRRLLIFGGTAGDWSRGNYDYANDFWELTLGAAPAWHRLYPIGGTLARREGTRSAYDSLRNRWILSGGIGRGPTHVDTECYNDVVAIDLATMHLTELPALPRGPIGLFEHSITYDSRLDRLLVFGGAEDFVDGAIELSLAHPEAWRTLASVTPSAETRVEHADWFDARRNRLLIMGGGHTTHPFSGTNLLSFGRDIRVALDPPSDVHPRSRRPVSVVLYGSDSLNVAEIDSSTIRVGQASIVANGRGNHAYRLRDADLDGYVDALFDVISREIGGSPGFSVEVQARTRIGESVCGLLVIPRGGNHRNDDGDNIVESDPVGTRATSAGIELSSIPGTTPRNAVQLLVQIPVAGRWTLELRSVRGSLVASERVEGPMSGTVTLRPSSRLAPGVYWARLAGSSKVPVLRIVIGG